MREDVQRALSRYVKSKGGSTVVELVFAPHLIGVEPEKREQESPEAEGKNC